MNGSPRWGHRIESVLLVLVTMLLGCAGQERQEQALLMDHLQNIVGAADDGRGPGSPTSLQAIEYCDRKLREFGFLTHRQHFVWGDEEKLGPVVPNRAAFVPEDYKSITCTNLIAIKEGTHPTLKEHFIVLVAHIDGQGSGVAAQLVAGAARKAGVSDPQSTQRIVLTGANDNASSVASFLHIASRLQRVQLQRSVLILLVDAEEVDEDPRLESMGLGSRYFVRHPVIPARTGGTMPLSLDKIEVLLNCELLGNKSARLITIGNDFISTELGQVVSSTARRMERVIDVSHNTRAYAESLQNHWRASDHTHFARLGIPCVEISAIDAAHEREYYHTPKDTLEAIDAAELWRNTQFVETLLLDLDRRDALLVHDRDWGVVDNPTEHPFYRGTGLKRVGGKAPTRYSIDQFVELFEQEVAQDRVTPLDISVSPEDVLYSLWFRKQWDPNIPPERRPLIVFIGGGPGASAMLHAWSGLGPWSLSDPFPTAKKHFVGYRQPGKDRVYQYAPDEVVTPRLQRNDLSWSGFADLIFLDSPRGTGYSSSKPQSYLSRLGQAPGGKSTANATADFRRWLAELYRRHPELRRQPLYLIGASYGAIQVSWYAEAIHKANQADPNDAIPLSGVMLVAPGILLRPDPGFWQHGISRERFLSNYKRSLAELQLISKTDNLDPGFLSQPAEIALRPWVQAASGVTLYGLRYTNKRLRDSFRARRGKDYEPNIYHADLRAVSSGGFPPWCYNNTTMEAFFRDKRVSRALTPAGRRTVEPWQFCNSGVNIAMSMGVQHAGEDGKDLGRVMADLLRHKIKVMIYFGKSDLSVGTFHNGKDYAQHIARLAYGNKSPGATGAGGLRPIYGVAIANQRKGGEVFRRGDLTYVQVNHAGHLTVADNPALGYTFCKRFVAPRAKK